eukprot:2210062-Rhodomonas_salina.1
MDKAMRTGPSSPRRFFLFFLVLSLGQAGVGFMRRFSDGWRRGVQGRPGSSTCTGRFSTWSGKRRSFSSTSRATLAAKSTSKPRSSASRPRKCACSPRFFQPRPTCVKTKVDATGCIGAVDFARWLIAPRPCSNLVAASGFHTRHAHTHAHAARCPAHAANGNPERMPLPMLSTPTPIPMMPMRMQTPRAHSSRSACSLRAPCPE